jgi:hypothetical protein
MARTSRDEPTTVDVVGRPLHCTPADTTASGSAVRN